MNRNLASVGVTVGVDRLFAGLANAPTTSDLATQMAEGTGFEPAIRVNVCLFSRQVLSTTQPPLRKVFVSVAWLLSVQKATCGQQSIQALPSSAAVLSANW